MKNASTNFVSVASEVSHHGRTPEGVYREIDSTLKEPPAAAALKWLAEKKLTAFELRLVNVVIGETLVRRRAFAPVPLRSFIEGVGMTPGPFSRKKIDPALASLQAHGILRSGPGKATRTREGRPAKVWWLGYVDLVLATDPVAQTDTLVLATDPDLVLATDSVANFPNTPLIDSTYCGIPSSGALDDESQDNRVSVDDRVLDKSHSDAEAPESNTQVENVGLALFRKRYGRSARSSLLPSWTKSGTGSAW